jgi:hypothetical protein
MLSDRPEDLPEDVERLLRQSLYYACLCYRAHARGKHPPAPVFPGFRVLSRDGRGRIPLVRKHRGFVFQDQNTIYKVPIAPEGLHGSRREWSFWERFHNHPVVGQRLLPQHDFAAGWMLIQPRAKTGLREEQPEDWAEELCELMGVPDIESLDDHVDNIGVYQGRVVLLDYECMGPTWATRLRKRPAWKVFAGVAVDTLREISGLEPMEEEVYLPVLKAHKGLGIAQLHRELDSALAEYEEE